MDGTFNQDDAVDYGNRLMERSGVAYSFDLSAATDRLPVLIQILIIDIFFPGLGPSWARLLVGRFYRKGPRKAVKYSVGQPMGALSSWPMLAITHHFIVQLAAYRAGYRGWFTDYIVLGDDLVIYNTKVAREYLIIMKDLGVGINLTKSLQSYDCFEFAKRFSFKGVTLPVASFREMDVSAHNLDGLISMMYRLRGNDWKLSAVMKFKGYGYKSLCVMSKPLSGLPKGLALLITMLSYPGVSPLSLASYIQWLGLRRLGFADPSSLDLTVLRDALLQLKAAAAPIGQTAQLIARDIFGPTGLYLRAFNAYSFEERFDSLLEGNLVRLREAPKSPFLNGRWVIPKSKFVALFRGQDFKQLSRGLTMLYHLVTTHYLLEEIEQDVQSLLWPIQVNYMEGHRQSDMVLRTMSTLIDSQKFESLDDVENYMVEYVDWLTQRDVQPAKVAVYAHASGEVKSFSGQWLKFFALTRKALPDSFYPGSKRSAL
jgi:hypothetical protein